MPNAGAAREKFRTALKRWLPIDPAETLLVAVSGGVDSVVLLHLLAELPPRERPRLVAAHFDHALRGRSSAADARFVKKLCRTWGIPCKTGKAKPWKGLWNVESRARDLRYRFLLRAARASGALKILVAHHADDQAETFLIRWLQGAGLAGLGGMSPTRTLEGRRTLCRPLLLASRQDILAHARHHRLPFKEDPTNSGRRHLRSRVRRLMRALKKENPNLENRTAMNALSLQADEAFLSGCVEKVWQNKGKTRAGIARFPRDAYRVLPESLRFRLIQRMARELRGESYALPFEAVWKIDGLAMRRDGSETGYDLPSRLVFTQGRDRLELRKKPC